MAERKDQNDPINININARIFQEMPASDSMRADTSSPQKEIKENIEKNFMAKCRESNVGQALGRMYDSPLAQSLGKISGEIGQEWERAFYGRYVIHEATPESPQAAGIHGEQSTDLRADLLGRNAQAQEPDKDIQPPEPPEEPEIDLEH